MFGAPLHMEVDAPLHGLPVDALRAVAAWHLREVRRLRALIAERLFQARRRAEFKRSFVPYSDPNGRVSCWERKRQRAAALAARDRRMMRLAARGRSNAEIAAELQVSPATVSRRLRRLLATGDLV